MRPDRLLACLLALPACNQPPAEPPPLSAVAMLSASTAEGYARALEPRAFLFPDDHGAHPDFSTEWWYFTGNLAAEDGRRFGYQLTFFRRAVAPEMPARGSAWATRQIALAHFALTDAEAGRFHAFERTSRMAAGLAGAQAVPFRVWLEDWSAAGKGGDPPWRLTAREGDVAIDLLVDTTKPPVLHGERGLSRKGSSPGNASYYYSLTRMPTRGTVEVDGRRFVVGGTSWLDREWSTSLLEPEQVGWDWFSLQLDDGRELMLFQIRRQDGTLDPASEGTLVAADGGTERLAQSDLALEVTATWKSPRGAVYPAGWRLRMPHHGLDLTITPLVADQELDVSFRYWEGAVTATGSATGRGYVELVGYGTAADQRAVPPL